MKYSLAETTVYEVFRAFLFEDCSEFMALIAVSTYRRGELTLITTEVTGLAN